MESETDDLARMFEALGAFRQELNHLSERLRIAELKRSGVRMIDETPRPGAHHMRIAFVHPKSSNGVLTELCEPPVGQEAGPA